MTASELNSLKTEIHRLIIECEDRDLLLRAYEVLTGEPYPEEHSLTLKEPDIEYKTQKRSQRIPGLPYTHEERMEALQQSEREIEEGLCFSHEEVMKEMESWISDGQQKPKNN